MIVLYIAIGFTALMAIGLYVVIAIGGRSNDEMDKIINKEIKKYDI